MIGERLPATLELMAIAFLLAALLALFLGLAERASPHGRRIDLAGHRRLVPRHRHAGVLARPASSR